MKKVSMFLISVAFMCFFTIISMAGQWIQDEIGWKYLNDDGSLTINSWHQDPDEKWYCFGSDGYMLHDQWVDDKYYLGSSGAMLVDAITPDGYKVGADGTIINDSNVYQESAYENYYEKTVGDLTYKVYYNSVYTIPESNSILTINGFDVNKEGDLYVNYSLVSDKLAIKLPIKIERGIYEHKGMKILSHNIVEYVYEEKNTSLSFSKKKTSRATPSFGYPFDAEYILYLG